MHFLKTIICIFAVVLYYSSAIAQEVSSYFEWPDGKEMALSISFDDGRPSQIDEGIPLLDKYGVKATFYVLPNRIKERLEGWKQAVSNGHEMGNHTIHHPCTENFDWVTPDNAIENYTLDQIKVELLEANQKIQKLLGKTPESYAYTCGRTTVGRGLENKSYIPVVAKLFTSGRGWLGEASNNPEKVDLANVLGIKMDGTSFEDIKAILVKAREKGQWVVLAGHEIGDDGAYTTRTAMLKELMTYIQEPENKIWVAPVASVSQYIVNRRKN